MQALQPGQVFAGRYEVERALATGGMGAVYVVRHTGTSRRHALKVMLPALVQDADQRERFLREAQIAAVIGDPDHVVDVSDAGIERTTGLPFFVMELLQGRGLDTILEQRGALPPDETIALLEQLAEALTNAHARGVIHRDLKPENLFVVEKPPKPPQLKVLDFGIAKILEGAPAAGTIVGGTAHYMAPEQARPRAEIGPQTDVMAFGLLAFRMLAGRSYWHGTDIHSVYTELLQPRYEPATLRASRFGLALPPAFDTFFERTVTPNAAHRTSSANEAIALLRDAFTERAMGGGTGRLPGTVEALPAPNPLTFAPPPQPAPQHGSFAPAPHASLGAGRGSNEASQGASRGQGSAAVGGSPRVAPTQLGDPPLWESPARVAPKRPAPVATQLGSPFDGEPYEPPPYPPQPYQASYQAQPHQPHLYQQARVAPLEPPAPPRKQQASPLLAILLGLVVVLGGGMLYTITATPEQPPTPPPQVMPAAPPAAAKLPQVCRDTFAKVDSCKSGAPESVRARLDDLAKGWRSEWEKLAESESNRGMLETSCRMAFTTIMLCAVSGGEEPGVSESAEPAASARW